MIEISKQANLPTQFGDFMIQSFREKKKESQKRRNRTKDSIQKRQSRNGIAKNLCKRKSFCPQPYELTW